MIYTPPKKILERYADVLINFALNSGRGMRRGEVVHLQAPECAKPLYVALRDAVLRAGGTYISSYIPDGVARGYYDLASEAQLTTFHRNYHKGLIDEIDHSLYIIAETDLRELEGVDPEKIMMRSKAHKPSMDWRSDKENKGKFTWTLALYGTSAMAAEARMSLQEYWRQIIRACFLDASDPKKEWRKVFVRTEAWRKRLSALKIKRLFIEGEGVELTVGLGAGREWMGGLGRNIPSFELFTSPDWRQTEGWIAFNQPLYRYGAYITGIRLEFKKGEIVKATAQKNEHLLKTMIATDKGSRRLGEFSLTDRRLSRITRFMADTLFDENIGGPFGNMHLAVGRAYKDAYTGNPSRLTSAQWAKLGYNDSVIHTDIVTTTRRTVIAELKGGKEKVIYRDGQFVL
ncbi:thermophilic metalloprotease (M29) superfamily [Candidatus Uhrbacteria bacterium RIFCSPHIGHO2_12_FULL_54_23]|uniref:Thermophilic metalloprotease (M29) superfamily n=2 Tax=Candidatus Uhriibacteriota TaxID=1752732 RepID=A0A1F7UJR5_9BACT|nr:MAG: thermophilic metalloprotease (M29) superfamily [Candidatus Uhrbacteria bacterium RIFCSPHIGHO2_12_FULL_54_23]OGL85619.1 MAG: thermophilic metalloprotease (M29) superfamily [Candidatus Uhrbacteria bacterium RIFCSPLOWO2_01_FULL_55_36]